MARSGPAVRPAIEAEGVVKAFRHRTAPGPRTFRQWVEGGFRSGRASGLLRALDGVSFSVATGEMLGVIGSNGSGKSTLLRILGGVMQPDAGRVRVAAQPNGLLELNAGMHPDLTGRENIAIGGVLAGLLRSEVDDRAGAIIDFAELAPHIDDPVRTYSAGMRLRLGFAVAVHVDPRILLIDEVLSVGDIGFQQKCLDRIRTFKEGGCAIVLISHDLHQVASVCDRALWLDRGHARHVGDAPHVVTAYTEAVGDETRRRTDSGAEVERGGDLPMGERLGSREASIARAAVLGPGGRPTTAISSGSPLTVEVELAASSGVAGAHLSFSISDIAGQTILDVNTDTDRIELPPLKDGMVVAVGFERIDLAPGDYRVSVGLWAPGYAYAYDLHMDAYPLEVTAGLTANGPLSPPRRWSLRAT